jgi:hypothetical protein
MRHFLDLRDASELNKLIAQSYKEKMLADPGCRYPVAECVWQGRKLKKPKRTKRICYTAQNHGRGGRRSIGKA